MMYFLKLLPFLSLEQWVDREIIVNQLSQDLEQFHEKVRSTYQKNLPSKEQSLFNTKVSQFLFDCKAKLNNPFLTKEVANNIFFDCKQKLLSFYIIGTLTETNKFDIENSEYKNIELDVLYLKACPQYDGWSCGIQCLFNARALNQIITSPSINLSSENIQEKVKLSEINDFLSKQDKTLLQPSDITNYAKNYFNLQNLTVLGPFGGVSGNFFDVIWPYEVCRQAESLDDFNGMNNEVAKMRYLKQLRQDLQNNENTILHFPCYILKGKISHWILISLIKLGQKKPFMIVLDSAHWEVDSQTLLYLKFIKFYFINSTDLGLLVLNHCLQATKIDFI